MSAPLQHEKIDSQFDGVQMPDQEVSWQKMKKLLDKGDDAGILVPGLLPGCLGWSVLLLIAVLFTCLVMFNLDWGVQNAKHKENIKPDNFQKQKIKERIKENSLIGFKRRISEANRNLNNTTSMVPASLFGKNIHLLYTIWKEEKKPNLRQGRSKIRNEDFSYPLPRVSGDKHLSIYDSLLIQKKYEIGNNDSSSTVIQKLDSPANRAIERPFWPQPIDSTIRKTSTPTGKKLEVVAGIGLQQEIPISGQTAAPYSYYGRKLSASAYIPSIFLQLQNGNRWFLLGEFKFGSSQFVKGFSYSQRTKYDTASTSIKKTTVRVKKAYYHQLPFSFNYNIAPGFSLGAGWHLWSFLRSDDRKGNL